LNETISTDTNPKNIHFKGEQVREWRTVDGKRIELPIGYGITPFLRVSYILRWIFTQLGYTLVTNIFDLDPSLRRMVLINNTADSICNNGYLRYKDLIPEQMEIMTFLNVFRRKFGLEFIEKQGGRIEVVTWNSALTSLPDKDLSRFVADRQSYEFVDPSAIRIQMNRSLEPYSHATRNTLGADCRCSTRLWA
jgi:hypothetical protein